MDQGWAAVAAAIVGLVGALGGAAAGGYAAIRGAREGAERAARASLEQMNLQAAHQHDQWLLDQRRATYGELMRAARKYHTCLLHIERLIAREWDVLLEAPDGVPPSAEMAAAFDDAVAAGSSVIDAVMDAALLTRSNALDSVGPLIETIRRAEGIFDAYPVVGGPFWDVLGLTREYGDRMGNLAEEMRDELRVRQPPTP